MSESKNFKKSGYPLKLIVNIQSNQDRKLERTDTKNKSNEMEYTPGILNFINALVDDMIQQDVIKRK
ncbi:MAG: hypothetical protein H7A32_04780 [Deltaproteobacteria bacterium]|nr:hypothetical protein [Deltaproteobacteria bacterium]